jgi:TM2 domain-containing membrane protein YozV
MRKIALTLLLAAFVFAARANAGPYTVNDQAIEQVLHQAVNVTSLPLAALQNTGFLSDGTATGATSVAAANGGKDFAVALLLNFFLGGLGIHRLYLGTKTMTWVGYILTCGGIFGVVPLVDFIVLIIHNQDISPYVDNPHFFMWAGNM